MNIKIFQIDAFSEKLFGGNPAAVCPLNSWLDDAVLQKIAAENNLSETAFFVKVDHGFHIRWFTPVSEVRLCGHATLASAYVLFNILGNNEKVINFKSLSGDLIVSQDGNWINMDFPNQEPISCEAPAEILEAFKLKTAVCLKNEDYFLIFAKEEDVAKASPDLEKLKLLDLRGVGISSRGNECDFVSRFFAPKFGIDEDPVTGSAHTQLTPYWSKILGKEKLIAKQLSKREGELRVQALGQRIIISGQAVKYLEGTISI